MSNAQGQVFLVECPASIIARVVDGAGGVYEARDEAEGAAESAQASAAAADNSRAQAQAAASAANDAKNLAQTSQTNAANAEANAQVHRQVAEQAAQTATAAVESITFPDYADITSALGFVPTSVTGFTGVQSPSQLKAAIGLGQVDNTADANKPISTAQAAALGQRVLKTGDTMTGPLSLGGIYMTGLTPFIWGTGAGPLRFGTNDTERVRIGANGDVGIGTPSPNPAGYAQRALSIDGPLGGMTEYLAAGQSVGLVYSTSSAFVLQAQATKPLLFYTNGAERLRITSDGVATLAGKIGIGVGPTSLVSLRGTKAHNATTVASVPAHLSIIDTSASAGAGGSIALGSAYDGDGGNTVTGAVIASEKRPGPGDSAAQYSHDLVFQTGVYPSGTREVGRFTSEGTLQCRGTVVAYGSGLNHCLQMGAVAPYLSFYSADQATRRGYVVHQGSSGSIAIVNEEPSLDANFVIYTQNAARFNVSSTAAAPASDNAYSCGLSFARWGVVYAGTGSINTSDAREKTPVTPLSPAEIAAAKALAAEVGTYKFLSAVEAKGDDARLHVGMTVQRAIEIMEEHGLDPFAYGFICYDAWEAKPAVWSDPVEAVMSEPGPDDDPTTFEPVELSPARPAQLIQEARAAGDRFSFRPDELLMFLARGFDARLAALEAAASPQ